MALVVNRGLVVAAVAVVAVAAAAGVVAYRVWPTETPTGASVGGPAAPPAPGAPQVMASAPPSAGPSSSPAASPTVAAPPPASPSATNPPAATAQPGVVAQPNTIVTTPGVVARPVAPTPPPASAAATGSDAPPAPPTFDVVRVEPSGSAVVAGRAAPNSTVTLVDKGAVIATAKTDANGQFAMVPDALPAGDHELALTSGPQGSAVASTQSVTVAVPARPTDKVVVALAEPDKPTVILSDPRPAAGAKPTSGPSGAPATTPAPTLAIRTAEAGDDGSFYASGTAQPNANLRLALNGSPVATATADQAGHWSLKVAKGMAPGSYAVRADQVDGKTGAVIGRAEVPFDLPPPSRTAPDSQVAAVPASGGGPASDALVADLKSVKVTRGDNLWRISRRLLGRGMRYTLIYEANANQIRNERLIFPNQIFVVPKVD